MDHQLRYNWETRLGERGAVERACATGPPMLGRIRPVASAQLKAPRIAQRCAAGGALIRAQLCGALLGLASSPSDHGIFQNPWAVSVRRFSLIIGSVVWDACVIHRLACSRHSVRSSIVSYANFWRFNPQRRLEVSRRAICRNTKGADRAPTAASTKARSFRRQIYLLRPAYSPICNGVAWPQ